MCKCFCLLFLLTFWCWPNAIQFDSTIPRSRIIWICHCIHIEGVSHSCTNVLELAFGFYLRSSNSRDSSTTTRSFAVRSLFVSHFPSLFFSHSHSFAYAALDPAEIHFVCHTINIIIGNLQKRFLFLLHSRNWIYFFISLSLYISCSLTRCATSGFRLNFSGGTRERIALRHISHSERVIAKIVVKPILSWCTRKKWSKQEAELERHAYNVEEIEGDVLE